jgi:hypothetical protein
MELGETGKNAGQEILSETMGGFECALKSLDLME